MINYTTPFWENLKDNPIFCAFDVQGGIKSPYGIDGKKGISHEAALEKRGTYETVKQLGYKFTGVSLVSPIEINGQFLVCIDLDWKRSPTFQPEKEQSDLIYYLQGMGAAYETSYSSHGAHFWILCDKDKIPGSKKLANNCEIEVFSGFPDQRANVLLTNYDFDGELISVDLTHKLPPKKIKEKTTATAQGNATREELIDPLFAISPEDYDTWLKIGMILKYELGEDGYDLWVEWSKQSDKYDPFVFGQKWDSFKGDGLKAGTLIALAIENGYHKPKATAAEDFGFIDPFTGEFEAPPIPKKSYLEGSKIQLNAKPKAINWVIDNMIPEGVGVIAGSAGVGKTTAVMPLALIAAGFASHLDNLTASIERNVVVFTEDGGQIERILYGVVQHLQRQDDQKVTFESIEKRVHLYHSKRVDPKIMRAKIEETIELYTLQHSKLGAVPPLIIFDTASANFDLTDENSNSQVSASMSVLKEIYEKTTAPLWIIAHLTKSAKGQNVDELSNLSARGGGAWEGDANWTSVIGRINADVPISILKIDKERVGSLQGQEIHFTLTLHDLWLVDQLGQDVVQKYPVVGIHRQETLQRKKDEKAKKLHAIEEKIMAAVVTLIYPSGRDIYDVVKGNKDDFHFVLDGIIRDKKLVIMELPDDLKRGKKQTYLMIPSKETGFGINRG